MKLRIVLFDHSVGMSSSSSEVYRLLAIGYWLFLQLARGPNVPPSNPCGRMIKTAIISTSE
jgi:hypothetical protein